MTGPPWIGGDDVTNRPGYDTDHHGVRKGQRRTASAAPDNAGLREALARTLSTLTTCHGEEWPSPFHYRQADALLSGPLAALLAERDKAVAQVAAVRAEVLAMFCAWEIGPEARDRLNRIVGGAS